MKFKVGDRVRLSSRGQKEAPYAESLHQGIIIGRATANTQNIFNVDGMFLVDFGTLKVALHEIQMVKVEAL
jgi:hypothetical protein